MARISFSALVEEITGKLAGSVFQDSYGGFQIRTRVSPRNPQTKYQQLRRGEFAFLSAGWRFLTSAQRQTFIDAAGTPPGALNLYLQSNINLTLIEEPVITDYIPSSDPGDMEIQFDDVSPTSMTIKATDAPTIVPAGTKLLLQITFQKAPTKIFTNPSQYSPVISFDEGTDLSVPVDILSAWTARYGVLLPDKLLCLKSALIDKTNGLRGAELINCTNSEIMASKYIPLFTQSTSVANVGTGSEDLVNYSIPANTLATNSDRLLVKFVSSIGVGGGASQKRIWVNLASSQNGVTGGLVFTSSEIQIIRKTAAVAQLLIRWLNTTGVITESVSNDFALDFTVGITIRFETTAAAADRVTLFQSSVDLIKAP